MPITPEYTWAESDATIRVEVPLKGQPKSKVDIFATDWYLKISFPPYLLELDLERCIDTSHTTNNSRARIENGTLVVEMRKKQGFCGLWGKLGQIVHRNCDPEIKIRREESIKEQLKQDQELRERISARKHEDERLALRSQMNIEEAERRRIEEIKEEEKRRAEAEVYKAFAEMTAKQNDSKVVSTSQPLPALTAQPKDEENDEKYDASSPSCHQRASIVKKRNPTGSEERIPRRYPAEEGRSTTPAETPLPATLAKASDRRIWDETTGNDGDGGTNQDGGEEDNERRVAAPEPVETVAANHHDDDDELVTYVPEPRVSIGVVPVGFTPRIFPTPLRESKMADESAWIMKNRRHLHRNKALVGKLPEGCEFDDPPLDISESDPVWLKGRGDDLYRGGDFLGAVNAYTSALDADPGAFACLSNRAASYLRLGKPSECVIDCGAALGILQTLPETGLIQAKVLARRALAHRELGHYRLSLDDCKAALAFNPGDLILQGEIERAEPLARCESSKKEAVKCFASGDILGACELYTAALAAVPASPSCLSNRAACHLALKRPKDCVRDCNTVLELLCTNTSDISRAGNIGDDIQTTLKPPPGSVPPEGSDKRRQWVVATLLRRGRANIELGRLESALKDYREASALAPGDQAIDSDVKELEGRVDETVSPRH